MNSRASLYAVIAIYLMVLFGMGFVFRRLNRNTSDYFRSGSRGTWWLVGVSMFMSSITSRTFTANAGVAYTAGWSVTAIFIGGSLGLLLNVLFLAPWFRQLRATTFPEVVDMRWGPELRQLNALMSLFTGVLSGATILWSIGIFCSAVFGLPIHAVILALGLVVLIYCFTGGRWAVMAADFIQGLFLVPTAVVVTALCLGALGGIDGFFELVKTRQMQEQFALVKPAGTTANGAYGWSWVAAMIIVHVVLNIQLGVAGRYFTVKDGRSARGAALVTFVIFTAGTVLWFIPPMTARLLWPEQVMTQPLSHPQESAYAIACLNVLPPGLIGLVVVAMFSAALALDGAFNGNAAVFVIDVFPFLCRLVGRRPPGERGQFRLGQLFTVLFGLATIGLAMYLATAGMRSLFDTTLEIVAWLATPMLIPNLMGVFVKRVPYWGAFAGIAAATAPSVISLFLPVPWPAHVRMLLSLGCGCGIYLAAMPFWRFEKEAFKRKVERFFIRMHTSVDFQKEVGEANDHLQLRLIGGITLATGLCVSPLAIVSSDASSRWCFVFVAGVGIALGSFMLLMGRRAARREAGKINALEEGLRTATP